MLTLAIDTASDRCAVALWRDGATGALLGEREHAMARGHGEALFGMVEALLTRCAVKPAGISRFAAIRGPGTFTGLRIGLAAARGLALALNAEAVGITAFQLVAGEDLERTGERASRIVAIDARRGEIYVCVLGPDLEPLAAPSVATPQQAAAVVGDGPDLVIGSGAAALAEAALSAGRRLRTRAVARPAPSLLARLAAMCDPATSPPDPLYVRAPDAKLPRSAPLRALAP